MAHGDWFLRYPGTALTFGSYESGLFLPSFPEVGTVGLETDDTGRPRGDGIAFGQDFERESTVKFDVITDGVDIDTARALKETFAAAWRGDRVRADPGSFAELEAFTGRIAFGRPRRFVANDRDMRRSGIVRIAAEFEMASALWYDREQVAGVNYVPAVGGGIVAPIITPITTTASSDRSSGVQVGGTLPTWPVIRIWGPITDPSVQIAGLKFEVRTTLTGSQSIVIDTRPWSRAITRNGAAVAGMLSAYSTRLSEASLPPGSHEIVLRGISEQGTARAEVRWRNAYATY